MTPTDPTPSLEPTLLRGSEVPAPACHEALPWRVWTALWRRRLDRKLAGGADPSRSRALALRARQLTCPKARTRLADAIERRIRAAEEPPKFSPQVPPAGASVRAASAELNSIAQLLRSPLVVYARGVALAAALINDGESPLFCSSESASAWYWAQLALGALEGAV